MSHILKDAVLRKVSQSGATGIYRLEVPGTANSYHVLTAAGTRQLMKCPEVVGYDSYMATVEPTTAALSFLKEEGMAPEASILTILRGGLNYPLEECCAAAGIRIPNINFVSCERVIEKGVITGLDIKYEKLHIASDITLMIGDIIASGDTLRLCLQEVVDRFRRKGGSIRRIIFFTIGGTKAISLMEALTEKIREVWPSFEGFQCFFYEGVFTVYEDKGVTGVNIPNIDFGWKDGAISAEFRKEIVSDPDALFEKCIIYDGGARRYEIPAHIEEVLEYWNELAEVADSSDFKAFLAEKLGYDAPLDYQSWLDVCCQTDCEQSRELHALEQDFAVKSLQRRLSDICAARIGGFSAAMKNYISPK